MTRVAVADLGTNSTRLLVADVVDGRLVTLDRRLAITRLGQDVDRGRRLLPEAVARVERCLAEYAAAADSLGAEKRLAYATSAVRDAANGAEALHAIEARLGWPTRLLSGDAEALLTFRGACLDRRLAEPTLVIDLGGGSTELTLGDDRGPSFHRSLELGCVRLTERFLHGDPPSARERDALLVEVRSQLETHVPPTVRPARGIGVAGTATTLATLHLGLAREDPELVHGHVLPRAWIGSEAARLAATPVAELRARPGIEPGRAPVIAAGALALAEILVYVGLEELEVSESDILDAAALALAADEL